MGPAEFSNDTAFTSGVVFNQLAGAIDVQNGTNGLQLAIQGGGNFTGGYITTNQFGLTVLNSGSFTFNGTVTGTNTWEDAGNLVGHECHQRRFDLGGGQLERRGVCDHCQQHHLDRGGGMIASAARETTTWTAPW